MRLGWGQTLVFVASCAMCCAVGCSTSSTPAKQPEPQRGAVLSPASSSSTAKSPKQPKSQPSQSDLPPIDPADPFGLKLRIDGRETNGQVLLTIFRAMCTRVNKCGLPKRVESCMIDALEAACKDLRCDLVFAEDRKPYTDCAKAYPSYNCDLALSGKMPSVCPDSDDP